MQVVRFRCPMGIGLGGEETVYQLTNPIVFPHTIIVVAPPHVTIIVNLIANTTPLAAVVPPPVIVNQIQSINQLVLNSQQLLLSSSHI